MTRTLQICLSPNQLNYSKLMTNLLFSIAAVMLSIISWGQTNVVETLTSGTSWTVPCGVTEITVEVIGGGGGGGRGGGGCAGGGGGSGAYTSITIPVVANQVFNYTIGAPGPGASSAPGVGFPGGTTTFTDGGALNLSASGGFGGNVGGNGGGCSGGPGGNGGNPAAGGSNNTNGNQGTQGETVGVGIGGRGGSTPNFPGVGGIGSPQGIDGSPGFSPGGGGGGGGTKNGGYTPNGGAGASGAIIISYVSSVNQADAGPDQALCGFMTMAASIPSPGWSSQWQVVSGTAGIGSPTNPYSLVGVPTVGTCAELTWTLSYPGCPDMVDTIKVCRPVKCNDEPCGATPLSVTEGGCSWSTFSNNGATDSPVYPEPGCGDFDGQDLWFSAVVPANGILTIKAADDPSGGALLPGIALYTGACNDLTHVGCANSTVGTTASPAEITYMGEPGETVYIRYWNYFEYIGNFMMCASTTSSGVLQSQVKPGLNNVVCGTTLNFFDPGGQPGNYPANSGGEYTLCPSTPGNYITLDFSIGFFNVEDGYDKMTILNGGAGTDELIGQWDGANSPGTITSSAADGCLTVLWQADKSVQRSGWWAHVTCSPVAGVNDTICSATNCTGGCGQWVCGDGLYDTTNDGNGVEDLAVNTSGCFTSSGEIASKWFYFTALTTGTVEFSFDGPNGQDYNFAVWGPSTNGVPPCPMGNDNSPLRCSQADVKNSGNPVGLSAVLGGNEFYEGVEGNGWVDALDVVAGNTYAMILNIFQNGNPQPVIDMTIGGSAELDCLPVYLSASIENFQGVNINDQNHLSWVSRAQVNNAKFVIERSVDGTNWEFVGEVWGAGSTDTKRYYDLIDETPYIPATYYRLSQVDFDGEIRYHKEVISISSYKPAVADFVSPINPNPTIGTSSFIYEGKTMADIEIEIRNDLGQVIKRYVMNNVYPQVPYQLETTDLTAGMYMITFRSGDLYSQQKLSVVN